MEYLDDMSESDTSSTAADLEALEALQADASDLERIEELLSSLGIGNTNKVHQGTVAVPAHYPCITPLNSCSLSSFA
jgi:hypothetical protein